MLSLMTGCQTVSYYTQAVQGECQILSRQRPINKLLADPTTPDLLKRKLDLVLELRTFAEAQLKLPVNGHYFKYADLERPFVLWNVFAAPEFSLEAKSWHYPIVGQLEYRGYFEETDARHCAGQLTDQGFDVYVGGVEAYSTLGWFHDPVLNTFIYESETDLADILFHELAHQLLFVSGDTDFNEAFATAVAEEGVRRWWHARNDPAAYEAFLARRRHEEEFVQVVLAARSELEKLYRRSTASPPVPGAKKSEAGQWTAELRRQKQLVFDQLREQCQALETRWHNGRDHGTALPGELNNAYLNSVDTYYRLLPAFHALLEQQHGDLAGFYKEVRALKKLKKEERHRRLLEPEIRNTRASCRRLAR